jgi:hypothetical protein
VGVDTGTRVDSGDDSNHTEPSSQPATTLSLVRVLLLPGTSDAELDASGSWIRAAPNAVTLPLVSFIQPGRSSLSPSSPEARGSSDRLGKRTAVRSPSACSFPLELLCPSVSGLGLDGEVRPLSCTMILVRFWSRASKGSTRARRP